MRALPTACNIFSDSRLVLNSQHNLLLFSPHTKKTPKLAFFTTGTTKKNVHLVCTKKPRKTLTGHSRRFRGGSYTHSHAQEVGHSDSKNEDAAAILTAPPDPDPAAAGLKGRARKRVWRPLR